MEQVGIRGVRNSEDKSYFTGVRKNFERSHQDDLDSLWYLFLKRQRYSQMTLTASDRKLLARVTPLLENHRLQLSVLPIIGWNRATLNNLVERSGKPSSFNLVLGLDIWEMHQYLDLTRKKEGPSIPLGKQLDTLSTIWMSLQTDISMISLLQLIRRLKKEERL